MTREEIIKRLNDLHAVACDLNGTQCYVYVNGIGSRQLRELKEAKMNGKQIGIEQMKEVYST